MLLRGMENKGIDILKKINDERVKRGWSEYTLSKNSGIPQSTISTWYRKSMQPTIASLEKKCTGFGMSLCEFFCDETDDSISADKRELLENWDRLDPEQRQALLGLIKTI